ncbi:MAG TPA: hypothetical protein VF043_33200 [Ktedonobacteraceae bacterium]
MQAPPWGEVGNWPDHPGACPTPPQAVQAPPPLLNLTVTKTYLCKPLWLPWGGVGPLARLLQKVCGKTIGPWR